MNTSFHQNDFSDVIKPYVSMSNQFLHS